MKPGDTVHIEYIRPGKEITYFEEDLVTQDDTRLRTFKSLPPDIVERLSRALQTQNLIAHNQQVLTKNYPN